MVGNIPWKILTPNRHGDWISQRNDVFSTFIPMGDKEKRNTFFSYGLYCRGLETSRDAWAYSSNQSELISNITKSVEFYNNQLDALNEGKKQSTVLEAKSFITYNDTYISWSRAFISDLDAGKRKNIDKNKIVEALYRPFFKQYLYFSREQNNVVSRIDSFFPAPFIENKIISISGLGSNKEFSVVITNIIPDVQLQSNGQCFPLYWYEKKENTQSGLFEQVEDEYICHDAISDFILEQAQTRYGPRAAKEDIFYYVYGILHSPEYRKTFANDFKKMLPRLPLVEKPADFWAFSEAGRKLAGLHLNYEEQQKPAEVKITGVEKENFMVDKMRFETKKWGSGKWGEADKAVILYNADITISNIPPKA
jgi:predicted helicase